MLAYEEKQFVDKVFSQKNSSTKDIIENSQSFLVLFDYLYGKYEL